MKSFQVISEEPKQKLKAKTHKLQRYKQRIEQYRIDDCKQK